MTITEVLAATPLLRGLTDAELARVAALARTRAFAAGERIFREGTYARGCWVIRDGHVTLDASVPGRGSVAVQTLAAGDVLGWSWLVPPFRWHFGAYAVDDVIAVELDTDRLRELADEDPALGYRVASALMEALLQRLQGTRARLLDLYGNPRER